MRHMAISQVSLVRLSVGSSTAPAAPVNCQSLRAWARAQAYERRALWASDDVRLCAKNPSPSARSLEHASLIQS